MTPLRYQLKVRFPEELREFIEFEARRNASSLNSEIVRCVRLRMENVKRYETEREHVRHDTHPS